MRSKRAIASIFGFLFAPIAAMLVHRRARRVALRGDWIGEEAYARLSGYFREKTLRSVRVEVGEIGFERLRRIARRLGMPVISARAITLGGEVVIAREADRQDVSLLLHEIVHVVQFRELGRRGFLTRYLRDWILTGSYFEIGLEREAHGLQGRFDEGERFDAEGEVVAAARASR